MLVTRESTRFYNKNGEPKAQIRLLKFPEEYSIFERHMSKAFCHFPNVKMRTHAFCKGICRTINWKNLQKKIVTVLEELQARFDHFQELKPCFAFLVNPFIFNVVSDGCPVLQPFVTNLSVVETKLTGSKKTLVNATLQLISGHRFQ